MLDSSLRIVTDAQVEQLRKLEKADPPILGSLLDKALAPGDVLAAVLKEKPVIDEVRAWRLTDPSPVQLREEAAAVGVLQVTRDELEFRKLFPGLDYGVYCASHSMGKWSAATGLAIEEHLLLGAQHGIGAWAEGGWIEVFDSFRGAIAELVGAGPEDGDVAWAPNLSEGLAMVLQGLSGRMVTHEGHFTTAHYIHRHWAERTGSELVEVPGEEDGSASLERLIDAITPETTIVSLSHALYRSGYLLDVERIATVIMERCPEAVLLLDAYQTLGTVPVDVSRLPARTVVLGGGHKQLRAGTGAGFAWLSSDVLDFLEPSRVGWWGHTSPMAFDHGPMVFGPGASRLRTGTPDLVPMVALISELRVLASLAGGDLAAAIRVVRQRTAEQVETVVEEAHAAGLPVLGGRDPERRAAFVGLRVTNGAEVLQHTLSDGVILDFRAERPGAAGGTIRISANSASFAYELIYALERVLHYREF